MAEQEMPVTAAKCIGDKIRIDGAKHTSSV